MADAENPFTAGTANLRETAKWLVGGIIAAAVGVLAGSPLTNLGALTWGWRLQTALAGAGIAFALLGVLLWRALRVITSETVSFASLTDAEGEDGEISKVVEKKMADVLPDNCRTFAQLAAKSTERCNDLSVGADARYDEFVAVVTSLEPLLGFEHKRELFRRLSRLIFALTPFVVAGIGVYAWAASPPDPKVLVDAPRPVIVALDANGASAVTAALPKDCHLDLTAGAYVRMILLADLGNGRSELVYWPDAPGCGAVHLTQQNGRLFAPK